MSSQPAQNEATNSGPKEVKSEPTNVQKAEPKAKENKSEPTDVKKDDKAAKAPKQAKPSKGKPAPVEIPAYVLNRMKMWDEFSKKRAEESKLTESKIDISLPNGNVIAGTSGVTTPYLVAKGLSNSLAEKAVIAKVDGKTWDLTRPLEKSCLVEIVTFDSKEGAHTFWHSSAHVLGQALELKFPEAKLCIGPALEDGGFYYDVFLPEEKVSQSDYADLEKFIGTIVKEKQPFQRLVLKKEEAIQMFQDNPFKLEIIKGKVPDGEMCTAYRCGPLIDLCKGPHVSDTGKIKAMAVTKNSSAYWLAKAENASLQRVYGISFPDKKQLKEYQAFQAEAEKRDHRTVGVQQKLFFFHQLSPGSCFFLPHGARLYNTLVNFMRNQYRDRGYTEVVTPNVFNIDLWKTSGHYENYKEHMFSFKCEDADFAMKPMNCPGHCLMFGHTLRSYRELPIRLADFGVLHRNELSGALSGLTRVRRFQQDDAHIFCRQDQIEVEVSGVLDFLKAVYQIFGFHFTLQLATRPAKFLGEIEVWDHAEKALSQCLEKQFGKDWTINAGDGAFYGPKIDIQLQDALKRKHQCATIQLDFQLPIRFDLSYKNEDGKMVQPVIIHRAILGSVERMIAVLIEHTGGKWPFWLSPRQVIVCPVGEKFLDYGKSVAQAIHQAGFFVDVDETNNQLKKKIREGQLAQYNYILVVGEEEQKSGTVNVRNRDNADQAVMSVADLCAMFAKLRDTHA